MYFIELVFMDVSIDVVMNVLSTGSLTMEYILMYAVSFNFSLVIREFKVLSILDT